MMMTKVNMKTVWLVPILITLACQISSGDRILFLSPLSTQSHMNILDPFINELAAKGHTIDVISNWNSTKKNVRQISPIPFKEFIQHFPSPLEPVKTKARWSFDYVIRFCHKVFQNSEFQAIMTNQFDLIIVNGFLNDCFYGYLYKLQIPFIVVTSTPAPSYISETVGNYLPPSLVPLTLTDYSDLMTFSERIRNFCGFILARIFVNLKMLPDFEKVYRKYLGQDIPGIRAILSNTALILMNSHFSLNYPRPLLPDVIEIGGIHCRPAEKLQKELEAFVSGAKEGVIYFSLGSIIKSHDMPPQTLETFKQVFSRLPHRVIWKMESNPSSPITVPPNVKLVSWLNQQDLLGHPSTKLFITHGGLLSMQEAVYHSVPLLGIPVGIDQNLNMRKITDFGAGIALDLNHITEKNLYGAITLILNNNTFTENMKTMSKIFRDRETDPLQRAVYWTEYVLRHNGAKHLRSGARSMNILQYYSIDVIIAIIGSLVLLWIMLRAILKVLRYFYGFYRPKETDKLKRN